MQGTINSDRPREGMIGYSGVMLSSMNTENSGHSEKNHRKQENHVNNMRFALYRDERKRDREGNSISQIT